MIDVVTAPEGQTAIPKIELVRCDDWYVLIIGGEIYSEGHRLRGDEALEILSDIKLIEFSEKYFEGEENHDMESYLAKYRTVEVKEEVKKEEAGDNHVTQPDKMVWEQHKAIK